MLEDYFAVVIVALKCTRSKLLVLKYTWSTLGVCLKYTYSVLEEYSFFL